MNVLFIDSGIGGLSTLAQTILKFPNLNFIYFADDKFAPYGSKTASELETRLTNIISQFCNQANIVVLACNTASTTCLSALEKRFCGLKFVGILPEIDFESTISKALIVATPLTCKSKFIEALCTNKNIETFEQKHLAKLIDDYFLKEDENTKSKIDKCIDQIAIKATGKDIVVLGCTHYAHLKLELSKKIHAKIVDNNSTVANKLSLLIDNSYFSKNPIQTFVLSSENQNLIEKYKTIFTQTLAKLQNIC